MTILVILSTFWLGESSIWKKKFVAVQLMTKSLGSDKTLRGRRNKQELLLPMQYIESSRSFVRVDLTYFSYLGTSPAASWRAHHFPFPLRLFYTPLLKLYSNSQPSIIYEKSTNLPFLNTCSKVWFDEFFWIVLLSHKNSWNSLFSRTFEWFSEWILQFSWLKLSDDKKTKILCILYRKLHFL